MTELFSCFQDILSIGFRIIPENMLIIAVPFLSAIVIVKVVRSL